MPVSTRRAATPPHHQHAAALAALAAGCLGACLCEDAVHAAGPRGPAQAGAAQLAVEAAAPGPHLACHSEGSAHVAPGADLRGGGGGGWRWGPGARGSQAGGSRPAAARAPRPSSADRHGCCGSPRVSGIVQPAVGAARWKEQGISGRGWGGDTGAQEGRSVGHHGVLQAVPPTCTMRSASRPASSGSIGEKMPCRARPSRTGVAICPGISPGMQMSEAEQGATAGKGGGKLELWRRVVDQGQRPEETAGTSFRPGWFAWARHAW